MQPFTLLEAVIYNLVRAIPLIYLALFPFQNKRRYSSEMTALIYEAVLFVWLATSLFSAYYAGSSFMRVAGELAGIVVIAALYVSSIKGHPGKMLFFCFMLLNVGYMITVTGKCLEGYLFPTMAMDKYRWSASLCMAIVSPFILVPVYYFMKWEKKNAPQEIQPSYIWQFSWLVPTTFYLIWVHSFYGAENTLVWSMNLFNVAFLVIVNFSSFLIYYLILRLVKENAEYLRLREANHALAMQVMQYDGLNQRIALARQGRHDLRHHILYMETLVNEEDMEGLRSYLKEIGEKYQLEGALTYCSNTTVNGVLTFFGEQAQKEGVDYRVNIGVPEDIPVSKTDLSILFGNLMENAVEACSRQRSGEKKIQVRGQASQSTFAFTIDNTYESAPSRDRQGRFRSMKHSGTGIGTESVRNIVSRYKGVIEFETRGDLFCVSVMLYLS